MDIFSQIVFRRQNHTLARTATHHRLVLTCTLAASLFANATLGQGLGSGEARARAETIAVEQIRSTWADGARAKPLTTKSACAIPNAMPAGPSSQAQVVTFSGAWASDDRFDATLWREVCPTDGNSSILYFRVVQAVGTSFICGGAITINQNGIDYEVRLVQTVAHDAFCDDLPGPSTFVIDQYPEDPQFDTNAGLNFTFKGAFNSYSVSLPARNTGNASVTPAVGLWWNSAESGTGYALDVKHGVLVVTGYSYGATGSPIWYLAAGPIVGNVFSATLDKYVGGQCISCGYRAPVTNGNDGLMTITFSSPTSGTMTLPGGRVFPIVPQPF